MNPLENLYDEIDRYKPDGSVRLMYDRIGQQVLVVKRRELNRRQLYQLLKKIQCQFLPEIYRLVESDGYLYIVEEQINGETLAQIVEYKGFLSATSAAKILLQICECLKELHLRKIVHRDLKPSNIMLTKDNQIKLIDLGISRIEKDFVESDTDVLGTKGYAPPEQFGFQQTDVRSDIYSLGITMQQLLGNDYRGYLTKILKKCTEIDPANRYQSAMDLALDVQNGRWKYQLKKFSKHFLAIILIFGLILSLPKKIHETIPIIDAVEVHEINESQATEEIPNVEIEMPVESEKHELTIDELKAMYRVEPVQIAELKFEDPIPIPETKNPIPKVANQSEPRPRSDPRLKHFCLFLLNGQPFETEIPSIVWKSWEISGDARLFPENYVLSLVVDNRDDMPLRDLIVKINNKYINKKTIPPNSSAQFDLKIGNQKIYRSFPISVRLVCDEENFSWSGGSFGKYKEFQLYLMK